MHWRFSTDLARRFPRIRVNHKKPLIKDGPFYSSMGLTAGITLSVALIEEDYGPHVARAVGTRCDSPASNGPAGVSANDVETRRSIGLAIS